MKAKIAGIVLAMAAVTPAWAADDPIGDLARQTGLSERKVQMVVGNRTAFAEYRYTYDRALKQFKAGIGDSNYERLMSGHPITIKVNDQARVVTLRSSRGSVGTAL